MIPSDHFVRYYNEVFKALEQQGIEQLAKYFDYLGELQKRELAEQFRVGGLRACHDYWERILKEENCVGRLSLTEDYFEFRMDRCPSLSKVLDNDAAASKFYCEHCLGWIHPVMEAAGLFPVMSKESPAEPRCVFRIYADSEKALDYERQTTGIIRLPLPTNPHFSPEK